MRAASPALVGISREPVNGQFPAILVQCEILGIGGSFRGEARWGIEAGGRRLQGDGREFFRQLGIDEPRFSALFHPGFVGAEEICPRLDVAILFIPLIVERQEIRMLSVSEQSADWFPAPVHGDRSSRRSPTTVR